MRVSSPKAASHKEEILSLSTWENGGPADLKQADSNAPTSGSTGNPTDKSTLTSVFHPEKVKITQSPKAQV